MIQESTGFALKNTEKWEVWLQLVRNTEGWELREIEITKEDLLIKLITREEIRSDWEDTDNNKYKYYIFLLMNI